MLEQRKGKTIDRQYRQPGEKIERRIKHKDYQLFLTKFIVVVILLLLQIAFILAIYFKLREYIVYIESALFILSIAVVLFIINKTDNPAYKLAWSIPILLFPVVGGLLYLILAGNKTRKRFVKSIQHAYDASVEYMPQDQSIQEEIRSLSKSAYAQSRYISNNAFFPVYKNTQVEYYPLGDDNYTAILEELKKAKHYIFMEYFIIQEGTFWNDVLDILVAKASKGVDVRLIYDDMGCVATLPPDYVATLRKLGIHCVAFNKFIPVISLRLNNRDHRKITVIDGHTAFTGGINLADEYINKHSNYGHWKDTGIMLKGDAVWNFTVMFLQTWNHLTQSEEDFYQYEPHDNHKEEFETDGYIQPYGDTPVDDEIVGENVYLNIINKAKYYVYIMTPYLIVDNEMLTALCLAAKSGIDVRIITPGIPDKKTVYVMTQSYYPLLIAAGVRIFQYTPGFVHAKVVVSDGEVATVGTINFDYRSLYLHFECGVWMYHSSVIAKIREDFDATLEKCEEVTMEECKRVKGIVRMYRGALKLFAPLM